MFHSFIGDLSLQLLIYTFIFVFGILQFHCNKFNSRFLFIYSACHTLCLLVKCIQSLAPEFFLQHPSHIPPYPYFYSFLQNLLLDISQMFIIYSQYILSFCSYFLPPQFLVLHSVYYLSISSYFFLQRFNIHTLFKFQNVNFNSNSFIWIFSNLLPQLYVSFV